MEALIIFLCYFHCFDEQVQFFVVALVAFGYGLICNPGWLELTVSPSWPRNHSSPPASASEALGQQARDTTLALLYAFF